MLEGEAVGGEDGEADEDSAEQREQLRRDLLLGHLLARSLAPAALPAVATDLAQQGVLPRYSPRTEHCRLWIPQVLHRQQLLRRELPLWHLSHALPASCGTASGGQ